MKFIANGQANSEVLLAVLKEMEACGLVRFGAKVTEDRKHVGEQTPTKSVEHDNVSQDRMASVSRS